MFDLGTITIAGAITKD